PCAPRAARRAAGRALHRAQLGGRAVRARPPPLDDRQPIAGAGTGVLPPHAERAARVLPEGGAMTMLSVVVPVYGCADCLVALHARLTASVAPITDRYEFVFV